METELEKIGLQVLGFRQFTDALGAKKTRQMFLDKNIYADSIHEVLEDPDALLELIPESERYNLYFTAGYVNDSRNRGGLTRQFKKIDMLWFDIDPLKRADGTRHRLESPSDVWRIASEALELDPEDVGAIFSGHGVQLFIPLTETIEAPTKHWFEEYRQSYREHCDRITEALSGFNIFAECDGSVFTPARVMRLPNTINRKRGEEDSRAYVINSNASRVDFFLESLASEARVGVIPAVDKSVESVGNLPSVPSTLTEDQQKWSKAAGLLDVSDCLPGAYAPPDAEAILNGCDLIKFGFSEPGRISEVSWYQMITVLARLYPEDPKKARDLVHDWSKGHPSYDKHETEKKIEHALKDTGPITCGRVDADMGKGSKCRDCKGWKEHLKRGKFSPIMLRGEDYISTKNSYFRVVKKEGGFGGIVYSDLLKYFEQEYSPRVIQETGDVFVYSDGYYSEMSKPAIENFVINKTRYDSVIPISNQRREFLTLVKCMNLVSQDVFFKDSIEHKANLNNGVYDFEKNELLPHSSDYGFLAKLPFDFTPGAKCPKFDEFLKWFSCHDPEIEEVIWGMLGYTLSGDKPWLEKMFVLDGEGENGKSTLIKLIKMLVGENNISALSLDDMKRQFGAYKLVGKLVNLSGESSKEGLSETAKLKAIISGDPVEVDRKNKDPITIENRAKLIFAVNVIGHITDTTHGFYRKFMLIPCKAHIKQLKKKEMQYEDMLFTEASGIFNKAIATYKAIKKKGEIIEPRAVAKAKIQQRVDSDVVASWVEEEFFEYWNVSQEESDYVSVDSLYDSFNKYANYQGKQTVNKPTFGKRLRGYLLQKDRRLKFESIRVRENGSQVRALTNIETIKARPGEYTKF